MRWYFLRFYLRYFALLSNPYSSFVDPFPENQEKHLGRFLPDRNTENTDRRLCMAAFTACWRVFLKGGVSGSGFIDHLLWKMLEK
jgi:hypothetical protein